MKDLKSYAISLYDSVRQARIVMHIGKRAKEQPVGLVYFDIREFGLLEERFSRTVTARVLKSFRSLVNEKVASDYGVLKHKCVGDDLFIFLEMPVDLDRVQQTTYIHTKAESLHQLFEETLNRTTHLGHSKIRLHVGTAIVSVNDNTTIERVLYGAIKEVVNQAKNSLSLQDKLLQTEFDLFLSEKRVATHFQPIVDLVSGEIHACEALTRGPAGGVFESPVALFDFAEQVGSLVSLEKIALHHSIRKFNEFNVDFKLFINVDARVVQDAEGTLYDALKAAEDYGITPRNIVLEITERNAVDDYRAFYRVLSAYRTAGYGIAVDDAGMGYSSLQAIAELKPDYIKIDKSLVRDVDTQPVKSMMIETLVDLARKLNCRIIAEGIERDRELKKVLQLGVNFGQGYYFSKPSPHYPQVNEEARRIIADHSRRSIQFLGESIVVGDIVRKVKTFDAQTKTGDVVAYFNDNEVEQGVVITRNTLPIGLVMKEKLFRNLATQYGVSLYVGREIHQLMDGNPLTVDASLPVENLSRITMARDLERLYDFVIVTNEKDLLGVATVQGILDTITTSQIEFAKDANPLTGLPGNRRIERDMVLRISTGQPFTILYADLDNFKWYNDLRGFQLGDMVIRCVGEILTDCVHMFGEAGDLVGHIGGDDFVIMTCTKNPEALCSEVLRRFEAQIHSFYDANSARTLQAQGELYVENREGEIMKTKGLSISLSILECSGTGLTLEQISSQASILKKQAKAILGNSKVRGKMGYTMTL